MTKLFFIRYFVIKFCFRHVGLIWRWEKIDDINLLKKNNKCPVHLPGQIIFCLEQNQICPIQNKFVKEKIFFVQDKNFVYGLKIIFAYGKFISCHGQNFCLGQKIFWLGQNYFVEDNSDFVPDKNLFVRADGQGIRINLDILRYDFFTILSPENFGSFNGHHFILR